jgi:hypothetical protein
MKEKSLMERTRNRITKPPTPTPDPSSQREGQHEELLKRVVDGFRITLQALDNIAHQHQDVKVVVELDTSVQKEILEVVKEIRDDVKKILSNPVESGASAEQLRATLYPLRDELKRVAQKFPPNAEFPTKGSKKKSTKQ